MNFLGVSFLLQLRITLRVYYIVYERGPGDLDNVRYTHIPWMDEKAALRNMWKSDCDEWKLLFWFFPYKGVGCVHTILAPLQLPSLWFPGDVIRRGTKAFHFINLFCRTLLNSLI